MLPTDPVPAAIVAAGIAPALLLLWIAISADSRPEPARVVWLAVALGAAAAIPVGFLELWLQRFTVSQNPWLAVDLSTLLFVGIPEETAKISIIAAIALKARDFDEPMDGIVYGTAVGLGFAALENVLYVAGAGANWEGIAITRGLLSVPFHGALGAIAGAFIAMARFGGALGARSHSPGRRLRLIVLAWLIPVILHSAFDSLLFSGQVAQKDPTAGSGPIALLNLGAIAVGIVAMVYAVRLARRIARHQKVWLDTKRLPPAHWRGVWAECIPRRRAVLCGAGARRRGRLGPRRGRLGPAGRCRGDGPQMQQAVERIGPATRRRGSLILTNAAAPGRNGARTCAE